MRAELPRPPIGGHPRVALDAAGPTRPRARGQGRRRDRTNQGPQDGADLPGRRARAPAASQISPCRRAWTASSIRSTATASSAPAAASARSRRGELGVLAEGDGVTLSAKDGRARALVVAGKPLGEPVMQYGPFVMSTPEELEQAVRDFQAGKF